MSSLLNTVGLVRDRNWELQYSKKASQCTKDNSIPNLGEEIQSDTLLKITQALRKGIFQLVGITVFIS